jgi:hypothetical protein
VCDWYWPVPVESEDEPPDVSGGPPEDRAGVGPDHVCHLNRPEMDASSSDVPGYLDGHPSINPRVRAKIHEVLLRLGRNPDRLGAPEATLLLGSNAVDGTLRGRPA